VPGSFVVPGPSSHVRGWGLYTRLSDDLRRLEGDGYLFVPGADPLLVVAYVPHGSPDLGDIIGHVLLLVPGVGLRWTGSGGLREVSP
jgi:hypothetical protein